MFQQFAISGMIAEHDGPDFMDSVEPRLFIGRTRDYDISTSQGYIAIHVNDAEAGNRASLTVVSKLLLFYIGIQAYTGPRAPMLLRCR